MNQHPPRYRAHARPRRRLANSIRTAVTAGAAALIAATSFIPASPALAADQNVSDFRITDWGYNPQAIQAATLKNGIYKIACMQQRPFGYPYDVTAIFTSLDYLFETNFTVTNETTNAKSVQRIGGQGNNHFVDLTRYNGMLPPEGDYTTVYDLKITHPRGIEKSFRVQREPGIRMQTRDHPQDSSYWQLEFVNQTSVPLDIQYATQRSYLGGNSGVHRIVVPAYQTVRPEGGYKKDNRNNNAIYYTSNLGNGGSVCDTGETEFPRATTSTTSMLASSYFFGQSVTYLGQVTPTAASGTYQFPITSVDTSQVVDTPTASVRNGSGTTSRPTPNVGSYSVAGGYMNGSIYNASTSAPTAFTVLQESVTLDDTEATITPARSITIPVTADHSTTAVNEGTVEVFNGSTSLGTGSVTNGVASIALTQLPSTNTGTLRFEYSGSSNYEPTTGAAPFTLNGFEFGDFSMDSDWIAGSTDTIEYGADVDFTLSVRDASGAPASGSYQVDGFTDPLNCTLAGDGTCAIRASAPLPGAYTLTARSTNTSTDVVFSPASLALNVTKASVSLTTDPLFGYVDGTHTVNVEADNALTTVNQGHVKISYVDGNTPVTLTSPVINGTATFQRNTLPRDTTSVDIEYTGSTLYSDAAITETSTAITHDLAISLDRSVLGGAASYRLGETATITASLETNATDLENYAVQFVKDGVNFGAPRAIDPATLTATIDDDFASVTAVPANSAYEAVLVRANLTPEVRSAAATVTVRAAATSTAATVTVANGDATVNVNVSSPYASAAFGGEATIDITGDVAVPPATVQLSADPTGNLRAMLFANPGTQGSGSHTFPGLPDGTYSATVQFAPASSLYEGSTTSVPQFNVARNSGGGGNGGGNGDGSGNGNGTGGGTNSGSGHGNDAGNAGLADTGVSFGIPLTAAGIAAALGALFVYLRRPRKA